MLEIKSKYNIFSFFAEGHPNIRATHFSTFEITKEDYLTERGTCIIGIKSNVSVKDFPQSLKDHLKKENKIVIILECENIKDYVIGYGTKNLLLSNPISIVFRKSEYIDDRTAAIKCNKAAKDINRKLINLLKKQKKLKITILY